MLFESDTCYFGSLSECFAPLISTRSASVGSLSRPRRSEFAHRPIFCPLSVHVGNDVFKTQGSAFCSNTGIDIFSIPLSLKLVSRAFPPFFQKSSPLSCTSVFLNSKLPPFLSCACIVLSRMGNPRVPFKLDRVHFSVIWLCGLGRESLSIWVTSLFQCDVPLAPNSRQEFATGSSPHCWVKSVHKLKYGGNVKNKRKDAFALC